MDSAVCTGMGWQLGIVVYFNRSQSILLSVVAVTRSGAPNWHAGQAEGIVHRILVIVVAPCLEVVDRRGFDSRRGIVEMVTCKPKSQPLLY